MEVDMDLKKLQKEIYKNKVDKGFNTTDINKEFGLLQGEVGEAYDAYRKGKGDLGEELADIAIYLLGLSEILGKDLEEEIKNKVQINKNRKYKDVNGTKIKTEEQQKDKKVKKKHRNSCVFMLFYSNLMLIN